MKPIIVSMHARQRLRERGTNEHEVRTAVEKGTRAPARGGRVWCRLNFPFNSTWQGKHYAVKQVAPVIVEHVDRIVVVTVYTFYF